MSLRRFSLAPLPFVLLWALWFLLPSTRAPALLQWKARLWTTPMSSPLGSSRDAEFVRALNAQDKAGDGTFTSVFFGTARLKAFEVLGHKFPSDPAICAAQIVLMTDQLRISKVHQPGPSSSGNLNWSVALAKTEHVPSQTLKSYFAATARGAKLEPNNTFWDWAQLIGLLVSGRDAEIWPVLRAARGKTSYDDHVAEGALARLRIAQSQGLVSPIQQIGIGYSTLYPHFASMREAARQISDHASGLHLLGDAPEKKRALEGMRDLMLLSRTMRRESQTVIGSLVGQALEAIALYGGSYSPNNTLKRVKPVIGSPVWIYASNPRSLAFFARQMKRTDIVQQTSRDWNELGTWHRKTRGVFSSSFLVGVDKRNLWLAHGGDWFGSLLVAGMPALLALALACSALLFFVPTWRRERETQPSLLSWLWGVILGVTALLVLPSAIFWAVWTAWRTTGATSFDIFLASTYSNQTAGSDFVPSAWQFYFWTAQCGVVALWFAATWNARRQGKATLGSRLRHMFVAPDDEMTRFDLSPLLALTGVLAASFAATVGLLAFLIAPVNSKEYSSLHDYAGLFLTLFAFVFAFPALWQLRTPQSRAFALILARRFAWSQLIFLTLLWGLLWLAVAPAQKRFDADFKRNLQIGEMQLLRKQLGI